MSQHLDLNLLARLAEGDFDGLTAEQRRHLAGCRQCQDAVVETASVLAEASEVTVPVAARTRREVLARTTLRPRRRTWRRRASWTAAPLAAALAWLLVTAPWRPAVDPELTGPVARVLSAQAVTAMVFPGATTPSDAAPVYRGADDLAAPLAVTVQRLTLAYNDDPANAHLARWLLGAYLAVDDLRTAELFARDAVRRHGSDVSVLVAASIVSYRAGDFDRATELLAEAATLAPGRGDIRFNQAVLALATGQRPEAAKLLQGFDGTADDPLARRAAALLKQSADSL